MPARGLGGGILEGLMYHQQRKDQLDQQAQEMALRNAQQRLQQDEFTRLKNNDVVAAKQHEDTYNLQKDEFDLRKKQIGENATRQKWSDILDLTKSLQAQARPGSEISPLADSLANNDLPGFMEKLKGLTVSPLIEEQNRQKWAKMETSMSAEDLKFFRNTRDTIQRNTPDATFDQASHDALAQLMALRAGFRAMAPSQQGSTDAAGAEQIRGMFSLPTTGNGANVSGQSLNNYRDAQTANVKQKGAFDAQINPIRIANAQLDKEAKAVEIQRKKDAIARMKATLPYDMLLKQWQVKRAITSEEVAKFDLGQKQEEAKWRKQMGYGTDSQLRVQHQAEGRAAELFKMRSNAQKELYGIEKTMNAYKAVLGSPEPSEQDAKYAEMIQERQIAGETLPGLNIQRQELKQRLQEIKGLESRNNAYRNLNVERTNSSGKPFSNNPPAITTPQDGNSALPKITPPPGARPNNAAQKLPQMQMGKVGDQRTKKTDYSKMSDAELKAALARKLQGK